MNNSEEMQSDLLQLLRERRAAEANGEHEQVVLLELDIAILRQKIQQAKTK